MEFKLIKRRRGLRQELIGICGGGQEHVDAISCQGECPCQCQDCGGQGIRAAAARVNGGGGAAWRGGGFNGLAGQDQVDRAGLYSGPDVTERAGLFQDPPPERQVGLRRPGLWERIAAAWRWR